MEPFSEKQAYIFKKIRNYLIQREEEKFEGKESHEALQQAKLEAKQTAGIIARMFDQQIEGLYQIETNLKTKLKKEHYAELCPLVWKTDFTIIKISEINSLFEKIDELLAQTKSQKEIELDIKNALQPYLECNPTYLKQKIEEVERQILENRQATQEALRQAEKERQEMLVEEQRTRDLLKEQEQLKAELAKLIGEEPDLQNSKASHSSSSSPSYECPMNTESTTKQFSLSKKRKASFEEEERKSPPLRAALSDSTKSPITKKE